MTYASHKRTNTIYEVVKTRQIQRQSRRVASRAWGRREWASVCGRRVSVLGEVLRVAGGRGCAAARTCLTPLNCTLRNGQSGEFYVMRIAP